MKRATLNSSRILFGVLPGIISVMFVGCGVKGKPLPPLTPAEIGRGVPTYKRAAEQAKPAVVPESNAVKPSPTPDRRGP